jgi:DNA-binding MarR family transcriptional regulator
MSGNSLDQDHVARVHAQWEREMPDVEIIGARVLARAGRITLRTRRDIDAVFKKFCLDSGEFYVLSALRRAGAPYALRPTEIYRSLMISSGGLTDRLNRLEAAGLVRRRASEEDARSMLVELTPAGRKRIEAAFRADMEFENRLVTGLTRKEQSELVHLLQKLALAIGA